MVAGVIWELVLRNTDVVIDHRPRFNSRIFFYLYLPATVFDSGALLANKWLLLNLLPILAYSLFGVVLYSAALGLTIYSLNQNDIFGFSMVAQLTTANFWQDPTSGTILNPHISEDLINTLQNTSILAPKSFASAMASTTILSSPPIEQLNNLTMVECLLLSIVLSTVDSSGMLSILKQLQLNERLYYLVLGENLMNNAVAIILTILLLDFSGVARVTVLKIYMTTLQFFTVLAGSTLLGILLAVLALIFVRVAKRCQLPKNTLSESQAIIEALLLLKLAYLTYALAAAAGMSSIVSIAVFSMLNDHYIKQNLNLRSQLAIKQMVMAAKAFAFTFIYPFLGMLLVEVAYGSQLFHRTPYHNTTSLAPKDTAPSNQSASLLPSPVSSSKGSLVLDENNKSRYVQSMDQMYWNFRFLSIVFVFTLVYRLIIVVALSWLCNLLSNRQLRTKFREQCLIAYGGFTSPLAMSIIQGLCDNDKYCDRTMKNRYLFMYTVLTITFISMTLLGLLIRPLVVHIHKSLSKSGWQGTGTMGFENRIGTTKVFDEVNDRVFGQLIQGVNSVIGRNKSSYDRIADFNESHARPWLTTSGSNINSLSVFYDNLILEETLNSDSFPAHDLVNFRALFRGAHPTSADTWRDRRRNVPNSPVKPSLDTIDEGLDWSTKNLGARSSGGTHNSFYSRQQRINSSAPQWKIGENSLCLDRQTSSSSSQRQSGKIVPPKRVAPVTDDESAMLKEFVMFNLKLDDARQRRHHKQAVSVAANRGSVTPAKVNVSSSNDSTDRREPIFSRIDQGAQPRGVIKQTHRAGAIVAIDHNPSNHLSSRRAVKKPNRYTTRTVSSASSTNMTFLEDTNDDQVSDGLDKRDDRERKRSTIIDMERSLDEVNILSDSMDDMHIQSHSSKRARAGRKQKSSHRQIEARRKVKSHHKNGKVNFDKSGPSTSRMGHTIKINKLD